MLSIHLWWFLDCQLNHVWDEPGEVTEDEDAHNCDRDSEKKINEVLFFYDFSLSVLKHQTPGAP